MMKRNQLTLSVMTVAFCATLGSAPSALAIEAHGGQVCQPILIPQATNLNYTKEGVTNVATTPYWVNCPLASDNDTPRTIILVDADGPGVICTYREWYNGMAQEQNAFDLDTLTVGRWTGTDNGIATLEGYPNVACKLPAGVTLTGIRVF